MTTACTVANTKPIANENNSRILDWRLSMFQLPLLDDLMQLRHAIC